MIFLCQKKGFQFPTTYPQSAPRKRFSISCLDAEEEADDDANEEERGVMGVAKAVVCFVQRPNTMMVTSNKAMIVMKQ